MFLKLRNRFMLLNLVIITFIMLIAFAAIYFITLRDVRGDIDMELHLVADSFMKPDGGRGGGPRPGAGGGGPNPHIGEAMRGGGPPQERSVSFMLQTNAEWGLTGVNSRFDMDTEFYEQALKITEAKRKNSGQFNLDGTTWAYLTLNDNRGSSVVYLDVTARQQILTTLVYTFSLVALAMLVVIFFTSRFFANRSIAPVKEAFQKQKQFIADASHELKTPLAVIDTNADVMLANSEDTILTQAKWLHVIKSETERMKKLTNDLLYLTEMDDTRAELMYAGFTMSEAVESVILTMEAVIFEKDITLTYDIEPDLTVHGSSEQIKQVVMILLDNAIKYTKPNGAITLSLQKRHHEAHLTVTNTGEGIAPEHLERIFDRFYSANQSRSRKHGGHGLGLAIAKSIVEQHRGEIFAKSVLNETTSMFVQIPLK